MTALQQLHGYLRRLEWRLRFFAASRGFALTATCALFLTLLFVYVGNRFEFAAGIVTPLRILLYLAVAVTLSLALVRPLLRLNQRRITRQIEDRAPEFKERLLTIAEREKAGENGAWMELLAEDTLTIARDNTPERIRSGLLLYGFTAAFAVAAIALVWMIAAGPGYWGYGASLLWTGSADTSKRPLYSIEVRPGNKTIRRRSDQAITAQLQGFSANDVVLHARYGKASKWDVAAMQPSKGTDSYQFVFPALNEPVEYYVEASHSHSKHYVLNVKDLPGVKRIRLDLHFPNELGLRNVSLDPAGDIRAVTGTEAEVHVETDRPLDRGLLVLDSGAKYPLSHEGGNWQVARIPVQKDGSYHVAAIDSGDTIRISEDYYIEAQKDEPPTVKISRPGHDPHVSPIEEMPITVDASDDYGLGALELRYAINGGPERSYSLLKTKGSKDATGKTMIAFEDLKAAPGDMVSLYAVARDAHAAARSEIVFAQADAFDYKFSQSQQAGGGMGGGGGDDSSDISKRQKQIIAATFNQLKSGKTGAARAEDAKFLAGEQAKLSEQAKTLAARMQSRELGASGKQFEEFGKLMIQASSDMGTAVNQLKPAKWNDALPPEQKALTSLLRAETLFRDIQLSMSKGGGGGGGNNAGRDLARMFDLELDTSKNQYETGQNNPPQQQADNQQALDQARQRLEALARRQQELAAQNQKSQAFEQRWQEEQLRREAEELKRQLQEMAQNSQNGQQQQQDGQQQGQKGQQQGQQGQQGSQQTARAGSQPSSSSSGSQQSGQQQLGGSQSGSQQAGSQTGGAQQSGSQQSGSQSGPQRRESQRDLASRQNGADKNSGLPSAEQTRQALRDATRAINRAEEEMRRSVSNHDQTARARAADQLRQAQQLMAQAFQKQAGGTVSDLASRAEQAASAQRGIAEKLKDMYGYSGGGMSARDRLRSYADPNGMPEMNDPNGRFGRRYGMARYYPPPGHAVSPEEKALADDKEKLAGQVGALQRQAQQQAQSMSGARPDVSAKIMRALSDAEGKELALRLQKNAEWMRQGYGERNLSGEDSVTAGLQQFGRAMRDVEVALNTPDPPAEGKQLGKDAPAGTRTAGVEQSPAQYRDAVAGYFKKLSQAK